MSQSIDLTASTLETLFYEERERLVRLCSHIVGTQRVAEDLAQETLLIAWNKRNQITDPTGIAYWLTAIARNVCRHWLRSQQREQRHLADDIAPSATISQDSSADGGTWFGNRAVDPLADMQDNFNFELELEREELAVLLDRAMALLPPETRALLIQHYIEEKPQAVLAEQERLTKSALGVRLHRGKQTLQRILTSDLSDDAIAFGLIAPEVACWQETRMWCWNCGQHRLLGQLDSRQGALRLRCPGCCSPSYRPEDDMVTADVESLRGLKAYKPAYSRIMKWIYSYYIETADRGEVLCQHCGHSVKIQMGQSPGLPHFKNAIYTWCNKCARGSGAESWWSLANSLPQVRQFWKEHPRMRILTTQPLRFADQSAIQVSLESVPDNARIEAIFSTSTFEVLHVG